VAYLQFVMHYSAILSNTYCCPNSKHWKWIGVMENGTQKFCSIPLLFSSVSTTAPLWK